MVDPLTARDFPGWCSRVARLFRSEFGPLAGLAAVPAVLSFAQLLVGDSAPVTVGFGLLMLLAMSLVVGAGLFTVVRRANGESAPWSAAVRFGLRRLPWLVGWTLGFALLITPVVTAPLLPGFATDSSLLLAGGSVVAALIAM